MPIVTKGRLFGTGRKSIAFRCEISFAARTSVATRLFSTLARCSLGLTKKVCGKLKNMRRKLVESILLRRIIAQWWLETRSGSLQPKRPDKSLPGLIVFLGRANNIDRQPTYVGHQDHDNCDNRSQHQTAILSGKSTLAQPALDPAQILPDSVEPEVRRAGAGEAVGGGYRVADKPGRDSLLLKRGEHLLALLDVTAQIAFAMDYQCRRLYVLEVRNRRLSPKFLNVL